MGRENFNRKFQLINWKLIIKSEKNLDQKKPH